nr:hypothetical protein [uncultured Acetatifactor sp.]
MTRKELREANNSKWSVLLQEAEASGLTVKEWCKSKGIRETTFYYRKKQAKGEEAIATQHSGTGHPAPCFVEVDICNGNGAAPHSDGPESQGRSLPEFLIQIQGCQIAVGHGFEEEDLRKIFRVASHVQ